MASSYFRLMKNRFNALLILFTAIPGLLISGTLSEKRIIFLNRDAGKTEINSGITPTFDLEDQIYRTTDQTEVVSESLGDTRVFWGHNFQFFSGDYRLGATLQEIGQHAYYYVENGNVLSSAFDASASTIYTGTAHGGVFKRQLSSTEWTDINQGLPSDNIRRGFSAINALVLTNTRTLIAGTDHGLFSRGPSDASWRKIGNISAAVFDVLVNGSTIYAAIGGYLWDDDLDNDGNIDINMGVRISTDGGNTWSNCSDGLPKDEDGEYIEVLSLAEVSDTVWAATPGGLFFLPTGCDYWEGGLRALDVSESKLTVSIQDSERDEAEIGGEFFRSYYRWLTVNPAEVDPENELTVTLYDIPDGLASTSDTISQWLSPLTPGILGDEGRYQIELSPETVSYNISLLFAQYDTLADGSVSMPIANMRFFDEDSVATIVNPRTEALLILEDAQDSTYEIGGQYATITYDDGVDIYRWSAKIILLREPNKGKRGVIIDNSKKIAGGTPDYWLLNTPSQIQYFSATTVDNQYLYSELASSADGTTLLGASGDVYSMIEHGGRIYAGTSSGVIYYDDNSEDWRQLPYILPYTPIRINSLSDVNGTLYAGGEFGLFWFRTSDSAWIADNQKLYGYITSDEIDELVEFTDSQTPADPNSGIYSIITDAFGEENLPDVDGSDMLTVLLHDIHDISEPWNNTSNGSEGGTNQIEGYVRLRDQSNVGRTNIRDMIYLTTKAAETEDRAAALAHNLVKLMMLKNDADEERWISEGIAFLGEKLCGFPLPAVWAEFPQQATTGITLVSGSFDAPWGVAPDNGKAIAELYTPTAMWMTYLYENLGGMPFVKALMTESANGIAGIDSLLPTFKPAGVAEITFSDVFTAWAIANTVNDSTLSDPITQMKYGYRDSLYAATINAFRLRNTDDIGMRAMPLQPDNTFIDYSKIVQPPLYSEGLNNWSTVYRSFFHLPASGGPGAWAGKTYRFNAGDHNTVRIWLVKRNTSGSFVVEDLTADLNDQNELTFNILDEFQPNADTTSYEYDIVLVGLSNQTPQGGSARIVQSADIDPPEVELSFLHNAVYPEFVSVFVMSHEHIHADVHLAESPSVTATRGYDSSIIPMTVFHNFTNKYGKDEGAIYEGKLQLDLSDTLLIQIEDLQDLSGNDTTYSPVPIVINKVIDLTKPSLIASYDGAMHVTIPAHAMENATYLTAYRESQSIFEKLNDITSERLESVLGIFTVGPSGLKLKKPGDLIINLSQQQEEMVGAGLYYKGNDGLVPIPSIYNDETGRLSATIDQLGTYIVCKYCEMPAVHQILPERYELAQNYPNPFNPSTSIQYTLPEADRTKISIYNLLGQEVIILVDGYHDPGYYQVIWDGKDTAGREVSSGIYFYRLQSGDFSTMKKMILVR